MNQQAAFSCVVVAKKKGQELNSTSGLVVTSDGCILTPALLLANLFEQKEEAKKQNSVSVTSTGSSSPGIEKTVNEEGISFEVHLPKQLEHFSVKHNISVVQLGSSAGAKHDIYLSSSSEDGGNLFRTVPRECKLTKCFHHQSLSRDVAKLFKIGDDWSIAESGDKTTTKVGNNLLNLLSYFLLLKPAHNPIALLPSEMPSSLNVNELHQGLPVSVVGTPFGSASISTFFNSRSRGIISTLTRSKALFFTDARCVPGMEGAAVWTGGSSAESKVAGLVISPFFWRASEWVGLSLACPLPPLLQEIASLTTFPKAVKEHGSGGKSSISEIRPDVSGMSSSVVMVSAGSAWGSGVIVSSAPIVVVTCAHVVSGNRTMKVRRPGRGESVEAKVIYCSPHNALYDLAFLLVDHSPPTDYHVSAIADGYEEGTDCYAVGHASFGAAAELGPSITRGVVSKCLRDSEGHIVMVQTSAGVQEGASGGGLFSPDGHLLAVLASHCRDQTADVRYPHVAMCTPADLFRRPLQLYCKTRDSSVFSSLLCKDPAVIRAWKIQAAPAAAQVGSKL